MNWVYAGIALIDLVKIFVVFKFIFAFELRKGTFNWVIAVVIMLSSLTVILKLKDVDNRIFITLGFQIIEMILLFRGRIFPILELTILLHLCISVVDENAYACVILNLNRNAHISIGEQLTADGVASIISLGFIIILSIVLSKKDMKLYRYLLQFRWYHFFYYFVCLLLSIFIIGYAGIMLLEFEPLYRLEVLLLIGASGLSFVIILLALAIHILIIQKNNLRIADQFTRQCMEEQMEQYESIGEKNEQLKRFRHDYDAHLRSLKTFVEMGEISLLEEYMENLIETNKVFDYISTNCLVGDAIFNEYHEKSFAEGIEFKVIGQFPKNYNPSNLDLCILLSNGVKNAFEAAQRCQGKKRICIEIKNYKGRVFLTIRNSSSKQLEVKERGLMTSKTDKENHGFGTRNMIDIIRKYDGKISWQYDEGDAITKIEI